MVGIVFERSQVSNAIELTRCTWEYRPSSPIGFECLKHLLRPVGRSVPTAPNRRSESSSRTMKVPNSPARSSRRVRYHLDSKNREGDSKPYPRLGDSGANTISVLLSAASSARTSLSLNRAS